MRLIFLINSNRARNAFSLSKSVMLYSKNNCCDCHIFGSMLIYSLKKLALTVTVIEEVSWPHDLNFFEICFNKHFLIIYLS